MNGFRLLYLSGNISAGVCFVAGGSSGWIFMKHDDSKSFIDDFKQMLSNKKPLVLVFIISAFTYVLIEQSIMSWLPTFNKKSVTIAGCVKYSNSQHIGSINSAGKICCGCCLKKINGTVLLCCLALAAVLVLVALPFSQISRGSNHYRLGDAPAGAFIFPLIGFFWHLSIPLSTRLFLARCLNLSMLRCRVWLWFFLLWAEQTALLLQEIFWSIWRANRFLFFISSDWCVVDCPHVLQSTAKKEWRTGLYPY